jgi:hypothetical protein
VSNIEDILESSKERIYFFFLKLYHKKSPEGLH